MNHNESANFGIYKLKNWHLNIKIINFKNYLTKFKICLLFSVTVPKGDTSVEIGSKPIELFCHINPNHVYYKEKVSCNNFSFIGWCRFLFYFAIAFTFHNIGFMWVINKIKCHSRPFQMSCTVCNIFCNTNAENYSHIEQNTKH